MVDKLKQGQLLSIETLKQNQTFSQFFNTLQYGRSKIQYLDNPFLTKPSDKIQINDLELLDKWDTNLELKNISMRILNYKRNNDESNEKNGSKNKEISEKKIKEEKKYEKNEEFITRISSDFAYLNNFDFEGLPYFKNQKNY